MRARKELQQLKQEAMELSIKPVGDSRMNHLEERGNDTIRVTKKQSDLDADVKCTTIQFYNNSHNFQSGRWIRLKSYMESPDILPWVKIAGQSEFGKQPQYWSTEVVLILLFTSF